LAFALVSGFAPLALAQTAPTAEEIRIYAGLHEAAAKGDVAEIEKLITEGEKPNIQDSRSRTPLHVAVYLKRHDAARALLRLGANPNALEIDRYDIVTIAAVANDAHLGHTEVVKILIAAKAPLNHVNNLGWTALMEAIVLGSGGTNHTATVRALVEAGADVNIADRRGMTPLQHARRRGYVEMARRPVRRKCPLRLRCRRWKLGRGPTRSGQNPSGRSGDGIGTGGKDADHPIRCRGCGISGGNIVHARAGHGAGRAGWNERGGRCTQRH
jgi:hypothetical protein